MVLGLVSVLVTVVAPIVLIVWAVRRGSGHRGKTADGRSVRRFFQYVLLYGLMIVAASGLADLVGLLFEEPPAGDDSVLARALTFSVFGIPMLVLTAVWSRRHLRRDPEEARSLGWLAYLTAAALTALVVAMTALHDVVSGTLGGSGFDGAAFVRLVVWGGLWWLHWYVSQRFLDAGRRQLQLVLGSLIGLATSLAGLVALLGVAVGELALGDQELLAGGGTPFAAATATVVVGVPVWIVYWLRGLARAERTLLWFGYVLPAGVGGSLILTVVGASLTLYQALVWFVGEPELTDAADHFQDTPTTVACVVVGAVAWWYHRSTLGRVSSGRTEVTRIYDYLMAGVGLVAAAVGVVMVVVALIESLVPPAVAERGTAAANSLLAGVTLLVVGAPLWWVFWSRLERLAQAAPGDTVPEVASPTRRTYLFVLFGVGGVAAVVSVLVAAFTGIQGALQDGLDGEVLRDMRVPLGILLTSGAISGYHWTVYRHDRSRMPAETPRPGPRYILLIGAPDPAVREEIERGTAARVDLWARADTPVQPWPVAEILDAVTASPAEALAVVVGQSGFETIPLEAPPAR